MSGIIMELICNGDEMEKISQVTFSTNPRNLITVEDMIQYAINKGEFLHEW